MIHSKSGFSEMATYMRPQNKVNLTREPNNNHNLRCAFLTALAFFGIGFIYKMTSTRNRCAKIWSFERAKWFEKSRRLTSGIARVAIFRLQINLETVERNLGRTSLMVISSINTSSKCLSKAGENVVVAISKSEALVTTP